MESPKSRYRGWGRWGWIWVLFWIGVVWAGEEMPKIPSLPRAEGKGGESSTLSEERSFSLPKLTVEEAAFDPTDVLPPDPLLYLEAVNGEELVRHVSSSPLVRFLNHDATRRFLDQTSLTLTNLFTNLPPPVIDPAAIRLAGAALRFANLFVGNPGCIRLLIYPPEVGSSAIGLPMLFLAEIGRDRTQPFESLLRFAAEVTKEERLQWKEGERGQDVLDLLQTVDGKAEFAFGILRNQVFLATSSALARRIFSVAAGGELERPFRTTEAYQHLPAHTDSASQIRGFFHLTGFLQTYQSRNLPGPTEWIDFLGDLLGRNLLYYDLKAEENGIREHFVGTLAPGKEEIPTLTQRVSQVCQPVEEGKEWCLSLARLVPHRTEWFFTARTDPISFLALLREGGFFGGSDYAMQVANAIREVLARTLGDDLRPDIAPVFQGDVALATFAGGEKTRWLLFLSLADGKRASQLFLAPSPKRRVMDLKGLPVLSRVESPATVAPSSEKTSDRGEGPKKTSPGTADVTGEVWAILDRSAFPNLTMPYLLVASDLEALGDAIDQATVGGSLAEEPDFRAQAAMVGTNLRVMVYYNLPGVLGVQYRTLLEGLVRATFPPSFASIGSLPPSDVMRTFLAGVVGEMEVESDRSVSRTTLISPMGTLPAFAALLVLHTPRWIRERARNDLLVSREHLQRLWLGLQKYATLYGRFPADLMQERKEILRQCGSLSPEQAESLFLSPAAIPYLGEEEARDSSYRYVTGIRPNDEPDMPILFENGCWHYDYEGQIRPTAGKEPTDTGEYLPWRLVLTLDGTIKEYREEEFQREILPRIEARESSFP